MSQPFTDTYILECNRVHSSQYNDDENTSVWTNSVNDGIKIDAGDKIQVHSAFVSDLGAEDATIEFRGKTIQDKVTLQKTVYSYDNGSLNYPTYWGRIEALNGQEIYNNVKDNRVLIETQYYKNANGEFYFTLPLEYSNPIKEQNQNWAVGPRHLYESKVFPYVFTAAEGYGATTLAPELSKRLYDDWTDIRLVDFQNKGGDVNASNRFTQIANDNSRFTIYRLSTCEREKVSNNNIFARDPALYNYTRVKDIIDFEVDKGFNSPANIATKVTEELSKPYLYESRYYDIGDQFTAIDQQTLGPKIESPTYKLFETATPDRFNIGNASAYFGYTGSPTYNQFTGADEASVHYAAQYECIGIKRPEFYDGGVEMEKIINNYQPPGFHYMAIAGSAMPSPILDDGIGEFDFSLHPIITNVPYNETNLNAIKTFFDSQDYYPKLFDMTNSKTTYNTPEYLEGGGLPITAETHRLLHINPQINASMSFTMNACTTQMSDENYRQFGSDNYHDYRSASSTGELSTTNSRSTLPFFVRYFPEYKNAKTDGVNYDKDTGRGLWGGFAFKAKLIDSPSIEPTVIGFLAAIPPNDGVVAYTDNIGFPTKRYLTLGLVKDRSIGYDRHFSAYGNAAICLYNGLQSKYGWAQDRTSVTYNLGDYGDNAVPTSGWYKQIYVGAKNPLLNFDSAKSRFTLSRLHSNEVIDTPVSASLEGLPDDAGQEVYKLNKDLGYRNYSPTMAPYSFKNHYPTYSAPHGATYTNKHGYILPGVIYDSLSGVFFTKFGITSENWKNSFWGICGYNYEDLNFTSGNTQGRITSNNTSELLYVTTNADVLTSAQLGFISTDLGAPAYMPIPNVVKRIIDTSNNPATKDVPDLDVSKDLFQLFPPTQVSADSATIDATNLPTKTLRPYYTIRSDIISDSNFYGGKDEPSVMPVVSVLDKMNQYGDFFYSGGPGQIEFTATTSKTITEIKTQICDPSGEPARLSPNSCVMYKVTKMNYANLNVIQDILAQEKNKKK